MPKTHQSPSFVIHGLAGEKKLHGTVKINGAKNAALKAFAASILFNGLVELKNVPDTADIHTMAAILKKAGAIVEKKSGHTWTIDPRHIKSTDIDRELAVSMRASIVLTGPMLSRFGKVSFPAPGGCVIGARHIDLFLDGYQKMGVDLDEKKNLYHIRSASGGLNGAEIFFNKQTVGGTETLMMAAVMANGTTILENCAMEPEIVSIAEWLNHCGAKISGAGTPTIIIKGTNGSLLKPKKSYTTIPDRIETGSFLILGALCAKDLKIENCEPKHVKATISLLRSSGISITTGKNFISLDGNVAPSSLLSPIADLRTHEYPGFPTDLQAPMTVFLTQANGESRVFETIYEGRFKYVEDLQEMNANITVMNEREIIIKGPTPLKQLAEGEDLQARDIRAGFAIVLAALVGKGKFTVNNIQLIDRGYEKLEKKLQALGAKVERV